MSDVLRDDLRALAEKWKCPGLTCELDDDVYDDLTDLLDKHETEPGVSERYELARVIWETSRGDEGTISATGANIVADAILAAGWRRRGERDELAQAAAWVAEAIGYPVETTTPDAPMPNGLWEALIDHVHADKSGRWHGNELDREVVAEWLAEEAGRGQ